MKLKRHYLNNKKEQRKETNNVTYKEARVYLDEVSKYGSVLGLDSIRNLLYELGNPQKDLTFIHIAGTNGKGSVLAYTSTIFSEAGLRTGRYVSPTVLGYRERIQLDGQWISEEIFAELVEEVQKAVARMEADGKASPTVFEVETAIAFLYFRNMKCDIVVLETGLGGSMDATNIVENTAIAAFATISRDHMGFLGDTLEEIASNKAGIIKPGCMVISAPQEAAVCQVLEAKAKVCGSTVVYVDPEAIQLMEESYLGQTFSYQGMENIRIPLAGRYQLMNAATAWEVIQAWNQMQEQDMAHCRQKCVKQESEDKIILEDAIREGFAHTEWNGRFTCIMEDPVFIVDGAHNEDAARRLRESVEAYFPNKKLTYIMGVFKDKEYEKIVDLMRPYAKRVYTVNLPDENRSLDAETLAQTIRQATDGTIDVQAVGEIEQAVELAVEQAEQDDVILAFGSLSYLGRVIQKIKRK